MATTVMKTSTGWGEWVKRAVSIADRCPWDGHGPRDGVGCLYCFARANARRRRQRPEVWTRPPTINWHEVLRNRGSLDGTTAYPGTHDITLDLLGPSIRLLENLLENDNQVLLVTKPRLTCVRTICDVFADHPYQRNIQWRFTITSRFDTDLSYWEPNAPGFFGREGALCYAVNSGYRVSVNTEPLTCTRAGAVALGRWALETLPDDGTADGTLWFGRMNKAEARVIGDTEHRLPALLAEWDDEGVRRLHDQFKAEPRVRWKNSFKDVLGIPRNPEPGMDV